ncbi:MAG: hypothetical protein C0622_00460 [Desulfuromonas sp.]|nr:MAG: hypothetical protein C0622_00460 [Desulfuromonas sp.]
MSNSPWRSLPARSGIIIAVAALVVVFFSSIFFFLRAYNEALINSERSLAQLAASVENSAAIAAYLDNEELALEVIRGLMRNDIVAGVSLTSSTGLDQHSGDLELDGTMPPHVFPLMTPFPPLEQVGELAIKADRAYNERNARQIAQVHVLTMGVYSLAIVVFVMLLVHRLLTRPLRIVVGELHNIEPGSDQQLSCPVGHHDDEIGQLVADSNELLRSIHATLERERALRAEVESLGRSFRLIFENACCGIILLDRQGSVRLHNPMFVELVGDQGLGVTREAGFPALFSEPSRITGALAETGLSGIATAIIAPLKTVAGEEERWFHCLFSAVSDDEGKMLYECIVNDVSAQVREERRTRSEADRDPLTLLLNRRGGMRMIHENLDRGWKEGWTSALMMIDLDKFKPINDTYGHEIGDRVLVEVADRLRATVRKEDLIVRWGGDEFLLLINAGRRQLNVQVVAEKLISTLRREISIGDERQVAIGASIGISLFPEHGVKMEGLIELADAAMYRAKERGGYCYEIHRDDAGEGSYS